MPTTTNVVNLGAAWVLEKRIESRDQICTVNVITYLLAFVTENVVVTTRTGAAHEIAEEAMQLSTRVTRAGKATTTETRRLHVEVATIFLN